MYSVIYEGSISNWFKVTAGVKQGCVTSEFIFITVLDWVMRRTVEEERNGIRWDFNTAFEDLVFADNIALISCTLCSQWLVVALRLKKIMSEQV